MTQQSNEVALVDSGMGGLMVRPTLEDLEADADLVVNRGIAWSRALLKVMEDQKLYADVSGKKYPEVEAWQMLLAFSGLSPITKRVSPLYGDDGIVYAYEAEVELITNSGQVVGGGVASCGMDSFSTRGRSGYDKDRAAQSTAQTWAVSKAARNKFSFVMKMAGYEATPADEMRGASGPTPTAQSRGTATKTELTCPIHNEDWFKKGRMKDYAHPVVGQPGVWCNREAVTAAQAHVDTGTTASPVIEAEVVVPTQAQDLFDTLSGHAEDPLEGMPLMPADDLPY